MIVHGSLGESPKPFSRRNFSVLIRVAAKNVFVFGFGAALDVLQNHLDATRFQAVNVR